MLMAILLPGTAILHHFTHTTLPFPASDLGEIRCAVVAFPKKSQARPGGLTKDLKLFTDCKLKQNNLGTQILDFI